MIKAYCLSTGDVGNMVLLNGLNFESQKLRYCHVSERFAARGTAVGPLSREGPIVSFVVGWRDFQVFLSFLLGWPCFTKRVARTIAYTYLTTVAIDDSSYGNFLRRIDCIDREVLRSLD